MVARMMDVINYFDSQHSVRNLLSYEEIDVIKLCRYCKNCEKCERFYSIKSEFRKKVFGRLTKTSNIGMQETQSLTKGTKNLKLYQLEIQHLECKK